VQEQGEKKRETKKKEIVFISTKKKAVNRIHQSFESGLSTGTLVRLAIFTIRFACISTQFIYFLYILFFFFFFFIYKNIGKE
jgi:hypothetical protein